MKLGPYVLGPNDTEENGIYTGDARELAKAIPGESVDLIFTDPVYSQIDDYRWLAECGARVLRDNSSCLAWHGGSALAEIMMAMSEYLRWCWNLKYVVIAKGNKLLGYNLFTWTTECLWYRKGVASFRTRIPDTYISTNSPDNAFRWQKNLDVLKKWMDAMVDIDAVVFDPFVGSGSTAAACKQLGRRYLAFEIDPGRAEEARQRVRETQPPLFVTEPEPQQAEMEL